METFDAELAEAGIMLAREGLQPSSRASAWPSTAPHLEVATALFPMAREIIAGFWLCLVDDTDDEVGW